MPWRESRSIYPALPSTRPSDPDSPSYAVSAHHHYPFRKFGHSDDSDFIGVYATLNEAKRAARRRYRQESAEADGWEHRWKQYDDKLCLEAEIEEGEADAERLIITIKIIQQRCEGVREEPTPRPRRGEEQCVYILRVEYVVDGKLGEVVLPAIFTHLNTANLGVYRQYEQFCSDLQKQPDWNSRELSVDGTASFEMEYEGEEEETWRISLEKKLLQ